MRTLLMAVSVSSVMAACAPRLTTPSSERSTSATDFSLRTIEGQTVRLSDYLGKNVVMLTFWATWCVPCLGEMPELERLHQAYRGQGLTILGVNMDGPETVANVLPTARRYRVTYPILLDEETRVVSLYNPTRDAPFAVLIDRQGKVADTRLGYAPGDEVELERTLQRMLATAEPAP